MKKALFPIMILWLCLLAGTAHAHYPRQAYLHYDASGEQLIVRIDHEVLDRHVHYIKNLDIFVNGTLHSSYEFDTQDDLEDFVGIFELKAYQGDMISVKAYCSSSVSIKEHISVGRIYPAVIHSYTTVYRSRPYIFTYPRFPVNYIRSYRRHHGSVRNIKHPHRGHHRHGKRGHANRPHGGRHKPHRHR